MTGGMSSGHYVGFYLAILGVLLLMVVFTRPVILRRLGSLRWPSLALALVCLSFLALFGSGSREIFFHTAVGPAQGVNSRLTQTHIDVALEEITRPAFVEYLRRLEAAPSLDAPERIRNALAVQVGTTVDLLAKGISLDPPPRVGQIWLLVSYSDRENALLAAIGGAEGIQRMDVAERLATRILPQAAAIVALRNAAADEERIAILRENPFVMPYAAEWLVSELDKLIAQASPAVRRELEQKRAYVQKYVDDPAARDLRSGRIVTAPYP